MKKRNHDVVLVTLADKNFIDQAKQLFSSVYWNAGWKGDYMLLSHEVPERDLKWFREKGILIYKCKPLSDKAFDFWPSTILSKFYLFTPEFKKWKNIIFLDSDIIVKASLDRLINLKGFYAATDLLILKQQFKKIDNLNKYNLKRKAFNVGLMAFTSEIISENTFWELLHLWGKYRYIVKYPEQAIINLYFYNDWRNLSLNYNVFINNFNSLYKIPFDKIKGICLHFARIFKPNDRPWDVKNHFYSEWKENLDRAELIDLSKTYHGKEWGNLEFYYNALYLNLKLITSSLLRRYLAFIGFLGKNLKMKCPLFYNKLKKYFPDYTIKK